MRRLVPWVLGALGGLGVTACGPSFQAVYEGDARFEHCYALEENPSLAMQQKASCWDDWLHGYTYGQTRDRVDYAMSRSRALRAGGAVPTDEAMMQAAPGEGRRSSIAPAPRSAFAPPPKTLSDVGDGGAPPPPASMVGTATWGVAALVPIDAGAASLPDKELPTAMSSPLTRCSDGCRDAWTACRGGDAGAAKGPSKRDAACERTYRGCLRACAK